MSHNEYFPENLSSNKLQMLYLLQKNILNTPNLDNIQIELYLCQVSSFI